MSSLSIGLSSLNVTQKAIALIGQNIANANTPGYHRQVAALGTKSAGDNIGLGVEILHYRRMNNSLVQDALVRNSSEQSNVTQQLTTFRQIQASLGTGEGSLQNLLENFFNQAEQLTTDPSDLAQRRVVLSGVKALTEKINSLGNDLQSVSEGLDEAGRRQVGQINNDTARIAELNSNIERATLQGLSPNDLLDQRDQIISNLAQLVDIRVIPQPNNVVNLIAAGAPLVVSGSVTKVEFRYNSSSNTTSLNAEKSEFPLSINGGSLAGIFENRNVDLADYRNRLEEFTQHLVKGVDTLHATGLSLAGPQNLYTGTRGVNSPTAPLALANLGFPPQAGSLYVTVTDQAGNRKVSKLDIDPNNDSLTDFASALSTIPNVQGVVDSQTNTLRILSSPGTTIDFAGRLPQKPDTAAITGTTSASISGTYNGAGNDTYTFEVVGNGTIGTTPGLILQVKNAAGQPVDSLNIGEGYQPGSDLKGVNGVLIQLKAGTANNGDQFTVPVVGEPDTAKILAALGLNTLFTGQNAGTIAVRSDLLKNPQLLAASKSGEQGDSSNLRLITQVRDSKTLSSGTETLRQFYASMVGDVGAHVQDLGDQQTAKQVLTQQLEAENQSVSGVDPNEELVILLQYQRAFQMSARFLSIVNETLGDLVNVGR